MATKTLPLTIAKWSPDAAPELERAAIVGLIRLSLASMDIGSKTAVWTRNRLEKWLKEPKTGALVARARGGQVDGLLIVRRERGAVRVVFMCVREARKGCGTFLIDTATELAKRQALPELRTVLNPNDERQVGFFCEKHGFEIGEEEAEFLGATYRQATVPVELPAGVTPAIEEEKEPEPEAEAESELVYGDDEEDDEEDDAGLSEVRHKTFVMDPEDAPPKPRPKPKTELLVGAYTEATFATAPPSGPMGDDLRRPTARAVVLEGDRKRRIRLASKAVFMIGRADNADIVVRGKKASRRHCLLRWEDGTLFLEDLGSANGTYLNGHLVRSAQLSRGDVIHVGKTRIGFDNLAVRSQDVSVAGKLPDEELDLSETFVHVGGSKTRRHKVAAAVAEDASVAELRQKIEQQARMIQTLQEAGERAVRDVRLAKEAKRSGGVATVDLVTILSGLPSAPDVAQVKRKLESIAEKVEEVEAWLETHADSLRQIGKLIEDLPPAVD